MKLFQKIKEALFEEEEYTEQIKITPEMRNEATPVKEVKKEEIEKPVKKDSVEPNPVVDHSKEKVQPAAPKEEAVSERELFNTKSDFPFFDFDEKEFEKQNSIEQPKPQPAERVRQANVLEYERKKKTERRTDYGRYEKIETVETTERRKFKPSPIISPVYGILDKDYVKSDIMQRQNSDHVDLQAVRNKAFGEKHEDMPAPVTTYYEDRETVTITEPAEKQKKVKTIDELLENTADVALDIDSEIENMDNTIEGSNETQEEKNQTTKEIKVSEVEDTLENDLFDLIDSMYSNKEDEE